MLRFQLGRIPVRVAPTHFLFSAIIGLLFAQGTGLDPLEFPALANLSEEQAKAIVTGGVVLSWVLVVFVSVLVHELGHALTSLAFGYRPDIELVWMGGHTRPNANGPIGWKRDILITLAGPIGGLSLGVLAFIVLFFSREPSAITQLVLGSLWQANLFWAVLNLLPVMPLDGGRITMVGLSHFFGQRGFLVSQYFALLVSAGMVLLGLKAGFLFLTIFFASYALQAWQLTRAGHKGEAGPVAQSSQATAEALAESAALFEDGKLGEARERLEALLKTQPGGRLEAVAKKFLGWVALKQGKGDESLRLFTEAQDAGVDVELEGLAAARSLSGDDHAALELWERAYRQRLDDTVKHEWAGALWREGKRGAALGLGIDPVKAAECAAKVPYIRGDFLRAAELGEEALQDYPDRSIAYNAACAYALADRSTDAMRMLEAAESHGFTEVGRAETDPDLTLLRGTSEFQGWLSRLREKSASLTRR